ncbi:cystatin-A3-like isoform X1 [Dysidea avara]|uniref:cystatin-A3-like isoform X1 n=1 Tax=Dysidea avara TaxID=196820 RepID=UPI00332DDD4B
MRQVREPYYKMCSTDKVETKTGEWTPLQISPQVVAESVKAEAEKKMGYTFDTYASMEFQTQLVNGTNYRIILKVKDILPGLIQITVNQSLEPITYTLLDAEEWIPHPK